MRSKREMAHLKGLDEATHIADESGAELFVYPSFRSVGPAEFVDVECFKLPGDVWRYRQNGRPVGPGVAKRIEQALERRQQNADGERARQEFERLGFRSPTAMGQPAHYAVRALRDAADRLAKELS